MTTLGEAFVPIRATLDKLDKDLAGARGKIAGALGGIGKTVGNIGKVALTGIVGGIVAIGGAAALAGPQIIGLGADANETASLLETSLGDTADDLNDRLRNFADDANRSFYELQAGSATFVAMTRAMGATEDQAADLSGNFVEMATDLGSFFNVATEDALLDIQSALAGSSETMTKYGVDIRETTLKQMALDQGLIKSASETLPQLMRAQLIEQAIMEQSADAMGDAIRTSDSWSNTMRGLTGRLRDVATQAGQKLIPALQPMLTLLGDLAERAVPWLEQGLDKLIPIIENISSFVRSFVNNLSEGMSPLDAFIEAIWDLAPPAFLDFLVDLRDNILPSLIAKITEIVTPIQEWIKNNVELNDVLIGLGLLFGAVIIPAIWAVVAPILAVIAVGAALIAAVSLIRQAWENDWGGIRTALTDAWENTIRPALQALGEWITGTLIPTVQMLWDTWVNVVWPQIVTKLQEAWAFIQPILVAIGEWITGTLVPTIQELYRVWVEDVWPTIQTVTQNVWAILEEVFTEVGRWINDNLVPWVEYFAEQWREKFEDAQKALDEVWSIIQPIWIAFQEWMEKKLPEALEFLRGEWKGAMDALSGPIQTVKDIWQELVDAVQGFWDWITSHDFSIDIKLPDLPDWATPGSPLPIHTAWKNFAQDMNRMTIAPDIQLGGGEGRSTNYNINAYYPYQEERSLRDDIKLMQLLTNG